MAIENDITQCFKCQKSNKFTILCKGCSNEFCQIDWNEHYELLNGQLNILINDYNQFKQTLNEHKQNQCLIEQINQWEKNLIEIIKQTAENCRQTVIEQSKISINNIEQTFNRLIEQIKEIREKNEFNEIDLNDLKRKLNEMNEELNNPSNTGIEEHQQSFMYQISVILSSSKNSSLPATDHSSILAFNKKKFQQDGKIVASGNGYGSALNQLNHPFGIFIDEAKTIFIADYFNHRIVEWK